MGVKSTTDESSQWAKAAIKPMHLMVSGPWDAFYREATTSNEVYLVKTHRPPLDDQPAIYVLRDGRKSCLSYSYFHKANTPKPYPSLLEIVIGRDFFGAWSDHYCAWKKRGNVLVIRYEQLVDASSAMLKTLADWVRHRGEIRPWDNPLEEHKLRYPNIVREGKVEWSGDDPAWTPFIDSVFFHLHGRLMVELGYASEMEAETARSKLSEGEVKLLEVVVRELHERKRLEGICHERQKVISELARAVGERTG